MPTRNVVLTDRPAKMIEKPVSSGQYQNASEVLRDGLRLIEDRAAEHNARLKALRAAVQIGIDDIEAGRYKEFGTFDELNRHLKTIADDAINGAAKLRTKV